MFSTTLTGASGELPDLISFLEAAYRAEKKSHAGLYDPADGFIGWAKDYLANNRPTEVFAVDNNYGVQLTNGQRIRISPDPVSQVKRPGDMANPDNSISITQTRR
jgi:hypothetical protein